MVEVAAAGGETTGAGSDSNGSTGRLNLAAQLAQSEIDKCTPPSFSSPRRPPPSGSTSRPIFSGAACWGNFRRRVRPTEEADAGSHSAIPPPPLSSSFSSFRSFPCGGVAVSTGGDGFLAGMLRMVTFPFAIPVERSRVSCCVPGTGAAGERGGGGGGGRRNQPYRAGRM